MAKIVPRTLPPRKRDGKQRTVYQVHYRDGTSTRRAKQFQKRKDAEMWMARTLCQVADGSHTPDSTSITVAEAVARFLDHFEAEVAGGRREQGSLDHYRCVLNCHTLDPEIGIGAVKMSRITKRVGQDFRDRLLRTRSEGLTRKTLRLTARVIDYAILCDLCTVNIMRLIKVAASARQQEEVEIPSKADVKELMERATGMVRPMIALAAFCGLRSSEVLGLRWDDVDFERGRVHVRQRLSRQGTLGKPKSKKGLRSIPAGKFVVNSLKEWRLKAAGDDLVFTRDNGDHLTYHRFLNTLYPPLFHGDGDRKDIQYMPPHRLRHFAVSIWIEAGFQLKQVSTFAGHHSVQFTLDTYAHVFEDPEDEAERFSEIESKIIGI